MFSFFFFICQKRLENVTTTVVENLTKLNSSMKLQAEVSFVQTALASYNIILKKLTRKYPVPNVLDSCDVVLAL